MQHQEHAKPISTVIEIIWKNSFKLNGSWKSSLWKVFFKLNLQSTKMLFTCGRNGKRCRKSKVHWCMCRHGECKFILHGSTISTFLYQLMQLCPSAFRCQVSLINSRSECYLFRFSLIKYLWQWFSQIMVGNQTWDDCAGQMTEGLWTENNMEIVVGYTTESQKAV